FRRNLGRRTYCQPLIVGDALSQLIGPEPREHINLYPVRREDLGRAHAQRIGNQNFRHRNSAGGMLTWIFAVIRALRLIRFLPPGAVPPTPSRARALTLRHRSPRQWRRSICGCRAARRDGWRYHRPPALPPAAASLLARSGSGRRAQVRKTT